MIYCVTLTDIVKRKSGGSLVVRPSFHMLVVNGSNQDRHTPTESMCGLIPLARR